MPRGRPVKCIHCGSTDTTSKGARRTKTMGIRKIRRCKACGRRFTPRNQKPVPFAGPEASQAEATEPVKPETAEPLALETSTSIESEAPGDEHQTVGL